MTKQFRKVLSILCAIAMLVSSLALALAEEDVPEVNDVPVTDGEAGTEEPAEDGQVVPADAPADVPADDPADAPADVPADDPADAPADIPEFDEESLDKIQKLCQGVDTLEFSVRAVNVLEALQIKHIFELVEKPESELLKHRNCGKKTVQEIKQKLQDINLGIGMTLTDDIKNEVTRRIAAEQVSNKED